MLYHPIFISPSCACFVSHTDLSVFCLCTDCVPWVMSRFGIGETFAQISGHVSPGKQGSQCTMTDEVMLDGCLQQGDVLAGSLYTCISFNPKRELAGGDRQISKSLKHLYGLLVVQGWKKAITGYQEQTLTDKKG